MKLENYSNYEIDIENGTIYSYKSNSFIGHLNSDGYFATTIYDDFGNRKTIRHHRFIWEAVNGAIPNGYEIHHKDHNRSNNSISNLELIESSLHKHIHFNGKNNPMHGKQNPKASEIGKLRSKKVVCYNLNGSLIKIYNSARETDNDGFISSNVSKCCNGILQTHRGYKWRFVG